MTMNGLSSKATVRGEARRRLSAQPPHRSLQRGREIAQRLFATDLWGGSRTLLAYVSLPNEPATCGIMRRALIEGKRLFVPHPAIHRFHRLTAEEMSALPFGEGLYHPGADGDCYAPDACTESPASTLVLLPGLAFDRSGRRLGRGGGYYDRVLAAQDGRSVAVGLCFSLQIVDRVPIEAHDCPVDAVITEEGIIEP